MRLQQLNIENFRGIREMRIHFHPQLNVFAGKNGAGKTTILSALEKAIDIARLNHVTGNERQNLENGTIIPPHDIRIGAEQSRISLQFSLGGKTISTAVSSNPEEMSSDLISHFSGAGVRLPHRSFSEERSTLTPVYRPNENIISDATFGADSRMGHTTSFEVSSPYPFALISEWEAVENSRLRKFIDSGKEFGKDHFEKDKTLQAVKNAIADITGFANLFDDREKKAFTVQKRLGRGEEVFLFSQLSSGEQHLVTFVATIAVSLAVSFPRAENPLHGEAVFMVDAIELHLHPLWQREIIPRLLAAFPNCQFVITTHSPQVLGNVRPESVFILKETDDEVIYEKPDESYGMTMDRLLELVIEDESRPAELVREQLQSLFEHISRKEFDDAGDIVRSLKPLIPTEPDLIRAEMMLHRKGLGL